MKKVAILQSNYIPWKGYFDIINSVDQFVIFDDVQYTRRDWRNRNKIMTPDGLKWLTIPVEVKGKYHQKISETLISDLRWTKKHWHTIEQFYKKAPFFNDYKAVFEEFFLTCNESLLSNVNFRLIAIVNEILGIDTELRWSSEFELAEGQTECLLGICEKLEADVYLSGPAARHYFNDDMATEKGISVEWMDYGGYPEYIQQHVPFQHGVTVLDLIFNEGPNTTKFMKSFS